jgi:hypothetical protein
MSPIIAFELPVRSRQSSWERRCHREGEFDDVRASVFGTPKEVGMDLAAREPAFVRSGELGD